MRRRGALWVGLAVVLAVASALAAILGAGGGSARILVADVPLDTGEDIEAVVLDGRASFRPVAGAHELSGLVQDIATVAGGRLSVPVEPGEPITHGSLGGVGDVQPEVGPAERLLSIPLSAVGAVAATVGPGVEVDVVASAVEGPVVAARVVAERAEIVAVEDRVEAIERGAGGVVIRVSDTEALVVSEALATGRDLRLIVRPRGAEGP